MEKYISVDAGKFATKVGLFNPDGNKAMEYKFRTKIDHGDFRDDNMEKNTYIIEINGETYKIGNGATTEAKLEMTKRNISYVRSLLLPWLQMMGIYSMSQLVVHLRNMRLSRRGNNTRRGCFRKAKLR